MRTRPREKFSRRRAAGSARGQVTTCVEAGQSTRIARLASRASSSHHQTAAMQHPRMYRRVACGRARRRNGWTARGRARAVSGGDNPRCGDARCSACRQHRDFTRRWTRRSTTWRRGGVPRKSAAGAGRSAASATELLGADGDAFAARCETIRAGVPGRRGTCLAGGAGADLVEFGASSHGARRKARRIRRWQWARAPQDRRGSHHRRCDFDPARPLPSSAARALAPRKGPYCHFGGTSGRAAPDRWGARAYGRGSSDRAALCPSKRGIAPHVDEAHRPGGVRRRRRGSVRRGRTQAVGTADLGGARPRRARGAGGGRKERGEAAIRGEQDAYGRPPTSCHASGRPARRGPAPHRRVTPRSRPAIGATAIVSGT